MRPAVQRASSFRAAVLVPIATAAALVAVSGPALANDPPPAGSVPPDQDPFYSAPADIGTYRPGQVGLSRTLLEIEPDNDASIAVARAAGYGPTDAPPTVVQGERRAFTLFTWAHPAP